MQTTRIFYNPSSYRDPSGFVFEKDNILFRQVNTIFKDDFNYFISSGCCDHLQKNGLLIRHKEINQNLLNSPDYFTVLQPERIDFISYPYEWCFDMLKDAALLTLDIARECMAFGLMLKDATPYNVQWHKEKLIFIDTLSFEKYDSSKPWIAYRQFCECFLSPLLLMHYSSQSIQPLLLGYPEGVPLSVTKSFLPWRSRFSFHTSLHIHLHERLAARSTSGGPGDTNNFTEKKLQHLFDSLQLLTQSLQWKGQKTAWENYYEEASQRFDYLEQKKSIIASWLRELSKIRTAVDLGANEGAFSKILARENIETVAIDFDHNAINNLYKKLTHENEKRILPLVVDVARPSPSIGLNNNERISFVQRTNVDLCLALALIHHLCVGRNVPFDKLADFFEKITNYLIIEFVPKSDQKIHFMIEQKKDIYYHYNEENFTKGFERHFLIERKQEIASSGRILYQMKKRNIQSNKS